MNKYDPEIAKEILLAVVIDHGTAPFSYAYMDQLRRKLGIKDSSFWMDPDNPYVVVPENIDIMSFSKIKISQAGLDLLKETYGD